jgi:putative hydrolase of the HAD superfamily
MAITHVFFDIGGVLGTNGWDREQRARAAARFQLDSEFEQRHDEVVGEWESGRMALSDYLETVVFYVPRDFSREDVIAFMLAESQPFPESIAIARRLAAGGHLRLFTLNNESAELNQHRIAAFGLTDVFDAFLSSCWLGIRKPARGIFERAVAIAQATPEQVLFVDDREQNLAPARRLGMQTHLFRSAEALERAIDDLGLWPPPADR